MHGTSRGFLSWCPESTRPTDSCFQGTSCPHDVLWIISIHLGGFVYVSISLPTIFCTTCTFILSYQGCNNFQLHVTNYMCFHGLFKQRLDADMPSNSPSESSPQRKKGYCNYSRNVTSCFSDMAVSTPCHHQTQTNIR